MARQFEWHPDRPRRNLRKHRLSFEEATTVFDPFCGVGTVLAVANAFGLSALGVEKARKRAEQARQLVVSLREL